MPSQIFQRNTLENQRLLLNQKVIIKTIGKIICQGLKPKGKVAKE